MKNILIGILVVVVVGLGALLLYFQKAEAPATDVVINPGTSTIVSTTTPTPVTPVATTTPVNGDIQVTNPKSGQTISSPVTLTGSARGNWFFEASAPVKIYDSNNKLLGSGTINADGEWMTTNFVPFSDTITFATSSTPTGKIVFEKDNPSGLPQNDKSYTVLVKFAQ
jgi:hypothetical protein